jgi:hypothetical protein
MSDPAIFGFSRGSSASSPARIIRERQEALQTAVDRAPEMPPDGSARFAGQVFDGGAMGTTGGLYYLTHPVTFGGPEVEGGPWTPLVDTGTTIPVDVIRGVPIPQDILIATAVAGRWVAELVPHNPSTCTTSVTVLGCAFAAIPVSCAGLTITLTHGATTYTGTTDAMCKVVFTIPPSTTTIRSGTAQGGTATTITLDAGASSVTNFYRGMTVNITGGTGSGQSQRIYFYNGTTKDATVPAAWSTIPDNTSTFTVTTPTAYDVSISGTGVPTLNQPAAVIACGPQWFTLSTIQVQVRDLCGNPFTGAPPTVTLTFHGGATAATGTTDASGLIRLTWWGDTISQRYDIVVDSCWGIQTDSNRLLTCGSTYGYNACIPSSTQGYLTDINGTWPVYGGCMPDGCNFSGVVCYMFAGASPLCGPTEIGFGAPQATATPIRYEIGCSSPGTVQVTRSWCDLALVPPCYAGEPAIPPYGVSCASCGFGGCIGGSGPEANGVYGYGTFDQCDGSFSIGGLSLPLLGSGPILPDPLGGTGVSFSF